MINLKISGRLGNQMFQYATAKALNKKFHEKEEKINISFEDVYKYKNIEGNENSLRYFNINDYEEIEKIKFNTIQKLLISIFKFERKLINKIFRNRNVLNKKNELRWKKRFNYVGIYLYSYGYTDFSNSKENNKILIRFFRKCKVF